MWITIFVGLGFTGIGQILAMLIQSDWKYLFYTMMPGGLMVAGFFTLCVIANFIGTRFSIQSELAEVLPSRLLVVAALMAVASVFVAMALGAESKLSLYVLLTGVGSLVLCVPAGFFIRGMVAPTATDR